MATPDKQQRLLLLFRATTLRERAHPGILRLVEQFEAPLRAAPTPGLWHLEPGFGGELVGAAGAWPDDGVVPAMTVMAAIDGFFRATFADLPPKVRAALPINADLLRDRLTTHVLNREVHKVAEEWDFASQVLRSSEIPAVRQVGEAWRTGATMLGLLAPPTSVGAPPECVFCHRHTVRGVICGHHRDTEGRVASSKWQRELFAQGLVTVRQDVHQRAGELGEALRHALANEQKDKLTTSEITKLVKKMFPAGNIVALWERAVAAGGDQVAASLRAWFTLPEVGDRDGTRMATFRGPTPRAPFSLLAQTLGSMGRFHAYTLAGGERARQRRTLLRDPKQLDALVAARAKGATLAELATRFEISISQLRRLVATHKPAGARKRTSASAGAAKKGAVKRAAAPAVAAKAVRTPKSPVAKKTPAKKAAAKKRVR